MILPVDPEMLATLLRERLDTDHKPQGADRPDPVPGRPAAVLVGLVPRASGVTILLTRRAAHLPSHPGQISFPGGAHEPHDVDAVATALRESQEEIGLAPERVQVLGSLGFYQTSSRFCVTPIVGLVSPEAGLDPDPSEVEEIFELPAAQLLNPALYEQRWVERGSLRIKSHFIECEGKLVWGATAGMLIGFARLLGALGEPIERDDLTYHP